ncbi:hypothetical protein N8X78_02670 [Planktomarina temperata]|nr:hypothetical protein [Planktomarina temperata]
MKRILLTTTSLVLAAGVAQAEITWSGTATAGIARDGKVAAVAQSKSSKAAQAAAIADTDDTVDATDTTASAGTSTNSITTALLYQEQVIDDAAIMVAAGDGSTAIGATHTGTSATDIAADLVTVRLEIAADRAIATGLLTTGTTATIVANAKSDILALDKASALLDATFGAAETATGDWDTYSEINATATATVAMDNGMTLSVSASVDAGTGYTFADDETFDAAKTNGVSLDSISLDMGTMGKLTLDEDNIAHLVDGDDDASADVSYANTIGSASLTIVADIDKDGDAAAVKGSTTVGWTAGVDGAATLDTAGVSTLTQVTEVAADVAWSAKLSMPLAGGTGYVAMDEEGGNAFGATATLSGVGISFDSKLEALEEELSIDRSNTIGLTYAVGATTFGATWNSVEDGDQWGISADYAADGLTISASTDEDSDWSVSGSMDIGGGASVVAGTNYTEDAYVGVSFAF